MNSLITSEYKKLNATLHSARPDYGQGGKRWLPVVHGLATDFAAKTVLDYGAGKGTLAAALAETPETKHLEVSNYDPAVESMSADPLPAEIVACTDVLEHVEPDLLDAVLDHIGTLAQKAMLFVIHQGPAKKFLPDGRNTHLVQESFEWWLDRLAAKFTVERSIDVGIEGIFVCRPRA